MRDYFESTFAGENVDMSRDENGEYVQLEMKLCWQAFKCGAAWAGREIINAVKHETFVTV